MSNRHWKWKFCLGSRDSLARRSSYPHDRSVIEIDSFDMRVVLVRHVHEVPEDRQAVRFVEFGRVALTALLLRVGVRDEVARANQCAQIHAFQFIVESVRQIQLRGRIVKGHAQWMLQLRAVATAIQITKD